MSSQAEVESELAALKAGKEQAALPAGQEPNAAASTADAEPILEREPAAEEQPKPSTSD